MSAQPLSRRRYFSYVMLLAVCVILLYFFWGQGMRFFLVPSQSMEPTLYPRDYILTLRAPQYDRGDIVVAYDPLDPDDLTFIVKRIAAVEGDTVRIEGGALFINGAFASEPYVQSPPHYDFPADPNIAEYVVPMGTVFLLGDNRNFSEDSSDIAWVERGKHGSHAVPIKDIIGSVRQIYLPWSHAGPVFPYPLTSLDELIPQQDDVAAAVVD